MIPRYSLPEMAALFTDEARFEQWLEVELLAVEGFAAELKGINNFIKTKLNRVVYRTMLVRAYNKRVASCSALISSEKIATVAFATALGSVARASASSAFAAP